MIRIAVCDDNQTDLSAMCALAQVEDADVCAFASGDALTSEHAATPFDAVIMDVMLAQDNGIDLAQKLCESRLETQIIFVSCNPEFMYASYRVPHVWYVKKEDMNTLLPQALARAREHILRQNKASFLVHCKKITQRIFFSDVLFFEQDGRRTAIHTRGGVLSEYHKIGDYIAETGCSSFVQCHKSYIANMAAVKSFTRTALTMADGSVVPISRTRFSVIEQYLTGSAEVHA